MFFDVNIQVSCSKLSIPDCDSPNFHFINYVQACQVLHQETNLKQTGLHRQTHQPQVHAGSIDAFADKSVCVCVCVCHDAAVYTADDLTIHWGARPG